MANLRAIKKFKAQQPRQQTRFFFQLTPKDATELALEFTKPPPTEMKREQQLVVSQEPFSDILRGHVNPLIREFVNRYLRQLHHRLEDIKDDLDS